MLTYMVVFFTHNMDRQDLLILLISAVTTVRVLWYCYWYLIKDEVHDLYQGDIDRTPS